MAELIKTSTIESSIERPKIIVGQLASAGSISGSISRAPVKEVVYPGPYTINPEFEDQVLDTSQKMMTDDVTVKAIAVSRTSNPSGGITVYIGGLE